MPIIDLQRRLREAGRIRIGEQVATQNGKKRPSKLATFRLTSREHDTIAAAANLYGGTPRKWDDAPTEQDQYEVITTADELDVILPPEDLSFSQWYELWTGGGCERRCDGTHLAASEAPCLCDPENRACKPTTRLNVILRDLPGLGVWRLESHGYYAAVELAGAVELIGIAARSGLHEAKLRLERREVKRQGERLKRFAVPTLDLPVSYAQLATATAQTTAPAVQGSTAAAVEGFQKVDPAALAAGPNPSVRDQIEGEANAVPKPRRANAATPLPPTGLTPGGQIVEEGGGLSGKTDSDADHTGPPAPPPPESAPPLDDGDAEGLPKGWPSPTNTIAIACREAGLDDDDRHLLVAIVTNGRATSSKDLDPMEMATVRAWLVKIKRGDIELRRDPDRLVEVATARTVAEIVPGEGQPPPATPPPPGEPSTQAEWLEFAAGRRKQGPILRKARDLATAAGVGLPGTLDEVPDIVVADLREWIEEGAA